MMKNSTINNTTRPFPALVKAIRRIHYPLVHLLLKTGVTFPQLAELIKGVYIDVADKKFRIEGKKQTQSRLSFLTGIHRKDVKRLHLSSKDLQEPENISAGVKLVARWTNDARFQDDEGKPLALPIKAESSPCFEELVQSVFKQDIRPRVILDEWLSLKVVKMFDKKITLCADAFIPREGLDEKAYFVGLNVADHLNAASQNLLNDKPEFFERCVYYEDLSDESIQELNKMLEIEGMKILKKINKRASQLKAKDVQKDGSKQRINIGLYLYHEENDH